MEFSMRKGVGKAKNGVGFGAEKLGRIAVFEYFGGLMCGSGEMGVIFEESELHLEFVWVGPVIIAIQQGDVFA